MYLKFHVKSKLLLFFWEEKWIQKSKKLIKLSNLTTLKAWHNWFIRINFARFWRNKRVFLISLKRSIRIKLKSPVVKSLCWVCRVYQLEIPLKVLRKTSETLNSVARSLEKNKFEPTFHQVSCLLNSVAFGHPVHKRGWIYIYILYRLFGGKRVSRARNPSHRSGNVWGWHERATSSSFCHNASRTEVQGS